MLGKTTQVSKQIFWKNQNLYILLERGIINVLRKGGTTGEELKNWSPITLLSQFYKLITGVIAGRMKKLIHEMIVSSQTGT